MKVLSCIALTISILLVSCGDRAPELSVRDDSLKNIAAKSWYLRGWTPNRGLTAVHQETTFVLEVNPTSNMLVEERGDGKVMVFYGQEYLAYSRGTSRVRIESPIANRIEQVTFFEGTFLVSSVLDDGTRTSSLVSYLDDELLYVYLR